MKLMSIIKTCSQFCLLLALISLSGCDPVVTYRFVIKNNSRYDLKATYSTIAFDDSTIFIRPDSTRLVFEEKMIGTPRELEDERFNRLFKSLKISIDDKIVYVQAPADKTRWKYSEDARANFYFGKIGKSIYTLELNDLNFLNNEPQK